VIDGTEGLQVNPLAIDQHDDTIDTWKDRKRPRLRDGGNADTPNKMVNASA
jgi:hypothetical protein